MGCLVYTYIQDTAKPRKYTYACTTECLIIGTQYKSKLSKMHRIHYNTTTRFYRNDWSTFRLEGIENIYIEGSVIAILEVAVTWQAKTEV